MTYIAIAICILTLMLGIIGCILSDILKVLKRIEDYLFRKERGIEK